MAAETQVSSTLEEGTKGRVVHPISILSIEPLLPCLSCSVPLSRVLLAGCGWGRGRAFLRGHSSLQGMRTH